MKAISFQAIYVLWLREMKRTWRAKSRVIGSLVMPLFFLVFMGAGFRKATLPGMPAGVNYMTFLIPGIVGMTLLFGSMFGGLQVLWDKEFGFRIPGITGLLVCVAFMLLITFTFIGLGLAFASKMKDMHGFQLVMNFVVFPIFFLSGALFPIQELPGFIKPLIYIDPLTYGIDGMRGALMGSSAFPVWLDFAVLSSICIVIVSIGSILFETTEVGQ